MLQPQLQGPSLPEFATKSFISLFQAQVARDASRIAITCETDELSFGELNSRANQLARYLRACGVTRETIVGICIDRSVEMAIGILGILKAGAAYLPIDPDYPTERLAFMLNDARPALVITKENSVGALSGTNAQLVVLDRDWQSIGREDDANLSEVPEPGDLAYVIYTSGSTGEPKGVMIEHGNLANYLLALDRELQITVDDLYLHTASIAFSSSRRQLLLPLSRGAGVVIATSEQRKDPLALFRMIKQRRVTVMDAVPSFWRNCTMILESLEEDERAQLLDNKLRLLLSASEPMAADIPRTWLSKFNHPAQHVHMFGQTETAGIVCLYPVPVEIDPALNVLPVGNPIANTEIYILDGERKPCPAGVAGEVYIGGAGVGRGYLNRAALTSEKFFQIDGRRLYRTGDWARQRADGQIEFAGRRDHQVKLRGFRVELGEIEAILARHVAVRESAVVARDEGTARKLIAYVVASATEFNVAELRSFLAERLPDYAVPASFVRLEALPLSANGKVDRLALRDAEIAFTPSPTEFEAPQNETEERLVAIWQEVLRVDKVGRNDDFFELGGHSLLAAQVAARIRKELKVELPLRVLFEQPTVAKLAASVESATTTNSIRPRLGAFARNGTAPLSYAQEQFWLLHQSSPRPSTYNVRTALKITGELDVRRLQQALQAIVARHEILRTRVVVRDDSPVQLIEPAATIDLQCSDCSRMTAAEREGEVEHMLAEEANTPFDLGEAPLLRARLIKLDTLEHLLILTVHHIACDGWSINLLLRELTTLYQTSLPQLPVHYADFALWQRSMNADATLEKQLDYWKQQLKALPPTLDLPVDFARPQSRSYQGESLSVSLPKDLTQAIRGLSRNENATLFMTMLAAFQVLLSCYSGQEDIVVGSPVAGRSLLESEELIGPFVNTLVLRGNLSGNPSFREFLARVRDAVIDAFSNQDLPFARLVEELNPERSAGTSPLFQVMFALQNAPASDLTAEELMFERLKLKTETAKFDLSLEVEEETEGLAISIEYATDLFAPATIERMLGHLQNLLEQIVRDPSQSIVSLSPLTEAELHQTLVEWNNNRAAFPQDLCVQTVFEAQVIQTPDAVAAEFRGETLTYRELNSRANQLARYLRRQGIGPDVLVGISVERSLEMLVSILGVLKAGGGYVPLDPTYPSERIAFMIADANLEVIIAHDRHGQALLQRETRLISIDRDWDEISKESAENLEIITSPNNLAYVIYTSGSTGNPKGVMIEHRSLVNFAQSAAAAYEITSSDRVLQFGSLSFDLSVEEIFTALTQGATVVLRTEEMIYAARDFLHYCAEWQITVLDLPTAYWHELTDALSKDGLRLPEQLRLIIIGGEKAQSARLRTWKEVVSDQVRLVNTYGPTETTVAVTMCDVSEVDDLNVIPIGRPLANVAAYILDKFQRPVPIGVAGELHIGGPVVARGYLNRPDLTSAKFIPDRFAVDPNARLYRTGDLVRYRSDGNIEFVGRVDNQIKIRGFRIELEEIEQALRGHHAVSDCVVTLREEHDKQLAAYVVPQIGSQIVPAELRSFLKAKLPAYMMPAFFEVIDAMPLMPNGKIDRRALPEPGSSNALDDTFVVPLTPLQEALAAAWRDVLGLSRVGIHDSFFDLGGHSLLAARVVSKLSNAVNVNVTLLDIFQAPTIAALADLLYPRVVQASARHEFEALLAEIGKMTDEEAQQRLYLESSFGQSLAAA